MAVLRSHCIGLHQEDEMEPFLELPWECFQLGELRKARDPSGYQVLALLVLDVDRVLELGCSFSPQHFPKKTCFIA